MTSRFLAAALAAALTIPASAIAQDDDAQGDLAEIITWRVAAEDNAAWESTVQKIVAAAEAANLGQDRAWAMYSDSPTSYTLVFPISSFGYYDDPQQWMRSFEGTDGEAMLQEAFGEMQNLDVEVVANYIAEMDESWSRIPGPEAFEHEHVVLNVFEVRAGQEEAFGEAVEAYMQFFEEIDYPYAIVGHKIHFGSGNDAEFVTFVDDLSAYYGENEFNALVAAAGQEARLGELFSQLAPTINDWKQFTTRHRADLSYWPEEEMAAN